MGNPEAKPTTPLDGTGVNRHGLWSKLTSFPWWFQQISWRIFTLGNLSITGVSLILWFLQVHMLNDTHTHIYIYLVCNSLYLWNGQEVSVFPILIVFLPCIAYVCCVSHELILLITFLDVLVSDTPSLFWLRKLYLSFYAFLALPSPSSDFVCRFESTCAESLCLCSQCLARNQIDFVYSDVFYGCLQVSRNKIIVVRSIMISIYTHILWYHLLININR